MTPNPRAAKYFCYSLPLPTKFGMEELLRRRCEIVQAICYGMELGGLEDDDQELLAEFNALIFVTGNLIASLIADGKNGKDLWKLYSSGVQEIVNLRMLEEG